MAVDDDAGAPPSSGQPLPAHPGLAERTAEGPSIPGGAGASLTGVRTAVFTPAPSRGGAPPSASTEAGPAPAVGAIADDAGPTRAGSTEADHASATGPARGSGAHRMVVGRPADATRAGRSRGTVAVALTVVAALVVAIIAWESREPTSRTTTPSSAFLPPPLSPPTASAPAPTVLPQDGDAAAEDLVTVPPPPVAPPCPAPVRQSGFAAGALSPGTPVLLGARSGFAATSKLVLWGSDGDLARDLDMIVASGAKWIRFDFDWQSTETSRGVFDWRHTDRAVAAARARGLEVLATLAYTPAWARPARTTDKAPPTDPATFAVFARAAVLRYAPQCVRTWEVWNEPNNPLFWQPIPDPARYARLLTVASDAIRAADPTATVISAGLSPAADSRDGKYVSPRTFLRKVYEAGAGDTFDAVGMHPYAFPYGIHAPADFNQFWSMPQTYEVMVDHGDAGKEIWATEFGAPTGSSRQAVSESGQSEMVTQAWDQWTKWPFTGPIFWYGQRDAGTDSSNVEDNFGLLRRDFTPKPALAELTRVLRLVDPRRG